MYDPITHCPTLCLSERIQCHYRRRRRRRLVLVWEVSPAATALGWFLVAFNTILKVCCFILCFQFNVLFNLSLYLFSAFMCFHVPNPLPHGKAIELKFIRPWQSLLISSSTYNSVHIYACTTYVVYTRIRCNIHTCTIVYKYVFQCVCVT